MFCFKCGKEIENDSKFCLYCGTAQGSQTSAGVAGGQSAPVQNNVIQNSTTAASVPVKKKTPVALIIGICAAVLLMFVIIAVILSTRSIGKKKEIDRELKLAERYLDELDYDRAVAHYQAVLKLDPKNEEAIKALGDTYIEWAAAEPEEAEEIYKEAKEYFEDLQDLGDNRAAEKALSRIEKAESESISSEAAVPEEKAAENPGEQTESSALSGIAGDAPASEEVAETLTEAFAEELPAPVLTYEDRKLLAGIARAYGYVFLSDLDNTKEWGIYDIDELRNIFHKDLQGILCSILELEGTTDYTKGRYVPESKTTEFPYMNEYYNEYSGETERNEVYAYLTPYNCWPLVNDLDQLLGVGTDFIYELPESFDEGREQVGDSASIYFGCKGTFLTGETLNQTTYIGTEDAVYVIMTDQKEKDNSTVLRYYWDDCYGLQGFVELTVVGSNNELGYRIESLSYEKADYLELQELYPDGVYVAPGVETYY